jgi:glycosyltransferase involved in cell wall biosynthesis
MSPALAEALATIPANKILWIGTVAELHPIKGHDVALRALKHLISTDSKIAHSGKHIIYTILGDGDERERLSTLVNDLGLSKHVFFLGRTENAWQYMKAFDIFLLASRSEALAYVLLEAGLATLPTIATAVGGIPEIIDDMKSGVLIQPEKPSEIAYALDFLATHEHVRREYAAALHKKILEQFNFETCTQKTFELYTRPN